LAAVAAVLVVTALVLAVRGPVDAVDALPASGSATAAPSGEADESPMPDPDSPPGTGPVDLVKQGRELYLTSCVSCHGVSGVGTADGPSLAGAGEASADFYLRTGRMPLAFPSSQPPEKPVAYSDPEIRALVAYVGTLCDTSSYPCPTIPNVTEPPGNVQEGSELVLANCAPCHNSAAIGGALSRGRNGPSLQQVQAQQVGEAMRIGPGDMPQFGPDVFTPEQVNSIVAYVEYLHDPESPGGASLGYTGPVAEGFVALLIGLGAMVLAIRWITREPELRDG
jgi:ubiquinol-cytochrome c reductase cytochrome c subunit